MKVPIRTNMDLSKLKVSELRKELKVRGLSAVGNKNELHDRLQTAMKNEKSEEVGETASVDDFEEDLLNEEDDESHLGENNSVLHDIDETLAKSPVEIKPPPSTKRKSEEGTTNGTGTKKIILNRSSTTEVANDSQTNGASDVALCNESDGKKVIKLSELSVKERLEMRAKKFGAPLSKEAKKEVRAERFGVNTTTISPKEKVNIGSTKIVPTAPASANVLKQRAERFGVKVSTTLTQLENQEKLDKRKARFGLTVDAQSASNGSITAVNKAQQRLERFKQPVK